MIPFYRPVLHGSTIVGTADAELARLKAENARLSADLDALRDRIDASALVDAAGVSLPRLKAENARLSADIAALRERIDALERWQKAEIDLWSDE